MTEPEVRSQPFSEPICIGDHDMNRFWIWMIVATLFSLAALSCSRNDTPTDPNSDPPDPNDSSVTMERYAAHFRVNLLYFSHIYRIFHPYKLKFVI